MRSRFQLSAGHVAAITRRASRAKRLTATLALGVIALFSALAPAQAQLPVYPHGVFPVAQAYLTATDDPVNGILAFQTLPSPNADRVDIQAFATFNAAVEHTPVVISSFDEHPLLTIQTPPHSFPQVLATGTTIESDGVPKQRNVPKINTLHTLLMVPPGTTFVLDVLVECTLNGTTTKQRHIDRYTWKVVATLESLGAVIKAFCTHPSDTAPFLPLIRSNQTCIDLLDALADIQAEISAADIPGAKSAIDAMATQIRQAAAAGKIASDRSHPAAALLLEDLQFIRASL